MSLPPTLLEELRGRIKLLAGFFIFAFGLDLTVFLVMVSYRLLTQHAIAADELPNRGLQWFNLLGVSSSVLLVLAARSPRVSVARLHALGLGYEVMICFVISMVSYWHPDMNLHQNPNLTWVAVVVVMFPLILPGPPRRMLWAALASAATAPLSFLFLELTGRNPVPDHGVYLDISFPPLITAFFAFISARVVYRLGKEVAEARELGSYRLEAKLGQGGMGEIWRARHRMLARPAAIKLIRALPDRPDPRHSEDWLRRFEREAQAIASLRSPHTVDLFDFGISSDGTLYYVMELLEGLDAELLVRRFGPIPPARAVHLLRQVCHSLSEAESRGLVHRDLKPSNIFLCRYGEDRDFVKVLDFGLVKTASGGTVEGAEGTLTSPNVVQGTPAFMAPEQALGRADVDGRADIYSLGCVAYWLLSGEHVFDADTPMGLLLHHVQTPPPPLASRTTQALPPELDRLVMECLAKDRAARPQSARELGQRLEATMGSATWSEESARSWWDAHLDGSPAIV